jgi:hypothetical protein
LQPLQHDSTIKMMTSVYLISSSPVLAPASCGASRIG